MIGKVGRPPQLGSAENPVSGNACQMRTWIRLLRRQNLFEPVCLQLIVDVGRDLPRAKG
jgi:hypothetical protein